MRPIFKKGKKSSPGNYRPVSLTSILCKIFESFIRRALYAHLIENKLLSEHQFGFCQGRSCVSQLLVTLCDWMYDLDNDIPVDFATEWEIIYKINKKSGAQDTALGHTTGYWSTSRTSAVHRNILGTVTQEVRDPAQDTPTNPITLELMD